jgi:XTP/dITP diphosphohydrolase
VADSPTLFSPPAADPRGSLPAHHDAALREFARLLIILDTLREHCPWDREQTLESLRHLTIEETYELSEAILDGDQAQLSGELGDVLLHIVFYARLGREQGTFELSTLIDRLNQKLIRRHPHVYGRTVVDGAEQVKANWEAIKLQEASANPGTRKSVLEGVPKGLPSLVKAGRIQDKVSSVGFDWPEAEGARLKVHEELAEVEAAKAESADRVSDELGDAFFALVNYTRLLGHNADDVLERANRKFIARFNRVEELAADQGRELTAMPLADMDALWDEAKREANQPAQ